MLCRRSHQYMNMVRHYDVTSQPITLAVKATERALDDICRLCILQNASSIAMIELLFQLLAKMFRKLDHLLRGTGFGVALQPIVSLFLPRLKHSLGQSIRETEGYEISCPILPPVWKPSDSDC